MTKKINKINSGNKKNFNNTTNSSADTNISKSRKVQIFHTDGKPIFYAIVFNFLALVVVAVGFTLAIIDVKNEINAVDDKLIGVVLGLSADK